MDPVKRGGIGFDKHESFLSIYARILVISVIMQLFIMLQILLFAMKFENRFVLIVNDIQFPSSFISTVMPNSFIN
jgi:hypothetical protein